MSKTKKLNPGAYNLLIISCIMWGFAPIFYRHALVALPIFVFLFFRYFVGALALLALDRKKFIGVSTGLVASIAILAFFDSFLANTFYSIGMQKTSIIHASIISLSVPFFVYLFAAIIIKERVHKVVVIGGLVSAAGLLITMLPSFTGGSINGSAIGDIAMVLESICTALGVVLARKLLHKNKIPPEQFSFIEYISATMIILPIIVLNGTISQIGNMTLAIWCWVIAAGVLAGALPIRMYFRAAKKLPAQRLADGSFVIPLVIAIVGVVYYKEAFTVYTIIGLGLVVIGLLVGHNKLHPVLVAHKLNLNNIQIQSVYKIPKKAYEYIRYN